MKRKFLIHNGRYYEPKYLTEAEFRGIINTGVEILNSQGEILTNLDLDWDEGE